MDKWRKRSLKAGDHGGRGRGADSTPELDPAQYGWAWRGAASESSFSWGRPHRTQVVFLGLRALSRGPISSKFPNPVLDPPGPPCGREKKQELMLRTRELNLVITMTMAFAMNESRFGDGSINPAQRHNRPGQPGTSALTEPPANG